MYKWTIPIKIYFLVKEFLKIKDTEMRECLSKGAFYVK